jgi:uncharacterized protein
MLTKNEKIFLLSIARKALVEYISLKNIMNINNQELIDFDHKDSILFSRLGAFVTLKNKDLSLRGCIGSIQSDEELFQNVISNTINAATKDPRFGPVENHELESLSIEISVMGEIEGPLSKENIAKNIEIGNHGLIVINKFQKGLLLPQVATEFHFNATEFLEQTCIKAGLDSKAYKDNESEVYRFASIHFNELDFIA